MLAKGNHRVTHIDKSCWTPPYVIKQTKFLRLRLSSLRHSWHLPILAITFGSFGLIAPKTLNYLAFQSFDFKRTWWSLFRYTLYALNLISTFLLQHILIRYQGLYYCHWVYQSPLYQQPSIQCCFGGDMFYYCFLAAH